MQKDLKRRQEEHEKDAEHELYMAEKRRQLRAARIQRILAKEMPGGTDGPDQFSTSYDPESGLLIWFDFALGIPTRFRKLQLVYCFAIDTQVQTKPKHSQWLIASRRTIIPKSNFWRHAKSFTGLSRSKDACCHGNSTVWSDCWWRCADGKHRMDCS